MALFTQSSLGSDFDKPSRRRSGLAERPDHVAAERRKCRPGLRHEEDGPVAPEADADDREDLERLRDRKSVV